MVLCGNGKNNVIIMNAALTPYVWRVSVLEPKCDIEKPCGETMFSGDNDNSASACHERGQISIVAPHEKEPDIYSLCAWDMNGTTGFNYEQIPDIVESAKKSVDDVSKYVCNSERFLTLIEAYIIILGTNDEEVKKYINGFNDDYGVGTKFDVSNQPLSESVENALFCLAGATHGVKITSFQEYIYHIPEKCRQIKYEEAQKMPYLWMLKPDNFSGKITLGGLAPGTEQTSNYLVADDLIHKILY